MADRSKNPSSPLWEALTYMLGQASVLVIGFLTFPLFTRVLSRGEYGLLALTNATLSAAGLVVGLGLPNAVVRFLPETAKAGPARRLRFSTTQLAGSVLMAALGAALLVTASGFVPPSAQFYQVARTFRFVAVLLIARASNNIILEFFRVARRQGAYNFISIGQKISNASFAILGYLLVPKLEGVLLGMAFGESALAVLALAMAYRSELWGLTAPDWSILRECVQFAAPIMLVSACSFIMDLGDRYLIQGYLGAGAVAGYAVAYDSCAYLQVLFVTSFRLSVLPELVTRYADKGREHAGEFLSKSFGYLATLLIGLGFLMVGAGRDVLTLLASSKYSDAANLLPWLVPGVFLGGLSFVFSSGLYLQKRTSTWFLVALASAALNIGLNVVLIPRTGVKGAAISTLFTYLFLAVGTYGLTRKYLPLRFQLGTLLRATVSGSVMLFFLTRPGLYHTGVLGLGEKGLAGLSLYGGLMLLLDRDLRRTASEVLLGWKTRWYFEQVQLAFACLRAGLHGKAPGRPIPLRAVAPDSAYALAEPERLANCLTEANEARGNRIRLLAAGVVDSQTPQFWSRHPLSGGRLPGGLLHHATDESAGGDLFLGLWLGHLAFLPSLAQAYRLTGDRAYAGVLENTISAWRSQNRPLTSIGWKDGLSVALRAISITYALSLGSADSVSPAAALQAKRMLLVSGALLERMVNRISFNHRVVEAYGLFCCGIANRNTRAGTAWIQKAVSVLNAELKRQFFPDGMHGERSPGYARFVLELYLHFRALGEHFGISFDAEFDARLLEACEALFQLSNADAALPNFGDDSDLNLFTCDRGSSAVLAIAATLFGRAEFKSKVKHFPLPAYWLVGEAGYQKFQALHAQHAPIGSTALRESGFYVMGSGRACLRLTGGAELTPRNGHSHADALSIELEVENDRPLVDPGSFLYNPACQWRDYFRSTAAHNTASVDERDQAMRLSHDNFGWASFPRVQVNEWKTGESFDYLDIQHDAYLALPQPVIHRRRVVYVRPDYWILIDDFQGEGHHCCDLQFQFAPGEVNLLSHQHAVAKRPWGRLELWQTNGDCTADLVSGQEQPIRGWVSFGYGHRVAAPSLRFRYQGRAPVRMCTLVVPVNAGEMTVEQTRDPDTETLVLQVKLPEVGDLIEIPESCGEGEIRVQRKNGNEILLGEKCPVPGVELDTCR